MADEIKFIRIAAEELPKLRYKQDVGTLKDLAYYLKFRVVSEDKSKTSKWSQNFEVPAGPNKTGKITIPANFVSIQTSTTSDGEISVSSSWNPNEAFVYKYVSKKKLVNNVATLTTAALSDVGTPSQHDFAIGNIITVSGIDSTFNGTFTVSAITATTISYALTAADVPETEITGSKIVSRPTKLNTKTFDIYIRPWYATEPSANWYYQKTVSVNNFQHIVKSAENGKSLVSVDVAVLIPTYTTLDEGSIIDPTTSFPTSILFQGTKVI